MPEQPVDPNVPPRIGRYEVLSRLGRGGMATVYLGRGDKGRRVAIKLIRPDLAADESFRRRFEREASYARRVRQAYIAPVLDIGDHEGQPFLVTEYIEGPTVAKAVHESGPMSAHEVEQLGEQVASALVAIHAVRLVHRDLKPSNVILGRTGPRVIDFGIARALDDSGGLTSPYVRLGTPSYMAPEQFDPDTEVDKPADVFAWGGLMIFASTGQPPFGTAGNAEEVGVLSVRIAKKDPRGLDGLEEPLRTLVREAMAKDPNRRPTARDLVRRLRGGDQPTPAPAAATTKEPAPTEPAATAPVESLAFTAPMPPRPPDPPPTARYQTVSDWQQGGVPADSPGAVLPTWTAHLVRAGIAIGVILLLLVGWLLLPEAARLLVGMGVVGTVVLAAIAVGIWRSASDRLGLLLWPLGGLVLLAVFWLFTFRGLHYQTWVGFDRDRVAILEGAGPDGLMGVPNVTGTKPFPTTRSELPSLLAAAVDDGIGVGDQNEGARIARCLPWIFTPTIDTPSPFAEGCSTSAFATTPRFPVPPHHTEDTTKHPPAVAVTDDQVLLASTSYDGSLQVSSSNDGLEFTSSKPVGDGFESDFEPALATDGTQFFLAWRDRNGSLAVASSTNGRDFGEPLVLNTKDPPRTAPALAYGDGMLVLAWVDKGSELHLWPAADAASLEFLVEQQKDLDERSPGAPNLQYARKTWTLTWAGSDHKVNIQTYRGSIEAIPTKHTLGHGVRRSPSTDRRSRFWTSGSSPGPAPTAGSGCSSRSRASRATSTNSPSMSVAGPG